MILDDGVQYQQCPACDLPVDWVDLTEPLWCCPTCDALVNERRSEAPECSRCKRPLVLVKPLVMRRATSEEDGKRSRPSVVLRTLVRLLGYVAVFLAILAPMSLALKAEWRWFVLAFFGPFYLLPVLMGGFVVFNIFSSIGELQDLIRDRRTRVIHGIEHGAAAVLEQAGFDVSSGETRSGFFRLRFNTYAPNPCDDPSKIHKAVADAVARIRSSEPHLAYHPRCGTSALVTAMLLSILSLAVAAVGLFLTITALTWLVLSAVLAAAFIIFPRPLGLLAQRYLTVSTDFMSAHVLRLVRHRSDRQIVYDVLMTVRLNEDKRGPAT